MITFREFSLKEESISSWEEEIKKILPSSAHIDIDDGMFLEFSDKSKKPYMFMRIHKLGEDDFTTVVYRDGKEIKEEGIYNLNDAIGCTQEKVIEIVKQFFP